MGNKIVSMEIVVITTAPKTDSVKLSPRLNIETISS